MRSTIILLVAAIFGLGSSAFAQKGNNELQVGAQLAIPIGQLADATNAIGYGFSAKTLFGFSQSPQQVSFEVGYNHFAVKKRLLPTNVRAQYRSWPIYTGYRYRFSNFYLESQAGVAINTIYASNNFQLVGDTKAYFAWAFTAGYSINDLDLALKYQSSDVSDGTDLTFVGIRAAYRFHFNKNRRYE